MAEVQYPGVQRCEIIETRIAERRHRNRGGAEWFHPLGHRRGSAQDEEDLF